MISSPAWGIGQGRMPKSASLLQRDTRSVLKMCIRDRHMGVESGAYIHWMVEYVCQHREPVKLLFCGAEGTGYENFIHNMVELEVESTFRYMETLCRLGYSIPELSPSLCHIIASGMPVSYTHLLCRCKGNQ